ncbi:Flp pilus assembly protein TadB [Brevibacillus sp. IT-7CA2]|uniref:type II secretion system F family protein n=1 Tax=Brevibacillus sp. IT-7CA2 TaxID=3026436 RepID=UPI0039DFF892
MLGIILSLAVALFILALWLWGGSGKKEQLKWVQIEKNKGKAGIKFLEEADRHGVHMTVNQYLAWWGVATGLGVALAILLSNPFMVLVTLGANYFVLKIYVSQYEIKTRGKAREQLGPAFLNLASAFRLQKNWLKALETIMPMLQEPLKSEFQYVYDAHKSGLPIGDAFQDMMIRLKVPEMQLFVTMAEISEQIGDAASEGVLVAGTYFQNKRLAVADLANVMISAVKENRGLTFMFIGVVLYFRIFQPDIFQVYMNTLLGKTLLTIYLSIAVAVPIFSYMILRKEI